MHKERASSVLEYMVLIVFILGAFVIFQKYIVRAFTGAWKKSGDAVAHGKQYDPRDPLFGGTADCFQLNYPGVGLIWVDERCYQNTKPLCDCTKKYSGFADPDCDTCVAATCVCHVPAP